MYSSAENADGCADGRDRGLFGGLGELSNQV